MKRGEDWEGGIVPCDGDCDGTGGVCPICSRGSDVGDFLFEMLMDWNACHVTRDVCSAQPVVKLCGGRPCFDVGFTVDLFAVSG